MNKKETVATENATKQSSLSSSEMKEFNARRDRLSKALFGGEEEESSTLSESEPTEVIESTVQTQPIEPTKRTTSKQRKADLEEYKATYLCTPKIVDRQPVFISRELRDRIDDVVRRLGERRMSVSGFLENLSRHHLESYAEELDRWRRL